MRGMVRAIGLLAWMSTLDACGYHLAFRDRSSAESRALFVAPASDPGIDIDAAAMVTAAVRRVVARGPGTRLTSRIEAERRLEVELIDSDTTLAPLADPGLRAAQYRAQVRLRGRLLSAEGPVLWTSPIVLGTAPYLSVPGPIEALEGARRSALERAAADAAERLIASLAWRRYGP